jgi:hypothetical protein
VYLPATLPTRRELVGTHNVLARFLQAMIEAEGGKPLMLACVVRHKQAGIQHRGSV